MASSASSEKEAAMKVETDARQVTIYINGTDQYHGRTLYSAIVHLCKEHGIAGATVSRCVEGYGVHKQLHTTRLLELTENLPVRIDIIDVAERIDPLLTTLDGMIGEGLVVVTNVHIRRFQPEPRTAGS
jgi:PII-like signaling protein